MRKEEEARQKANAEEALRFVAEPVACCGVLWVMFETNERENSAESDSRPPFLSFLS